MKVYYFDNAASSWPKPQKVIEAMTDCMNHYTANPGRGSHKMAIQASRILFEARKNLSKLFGIKNPNDLFFTYNATYALNQAMKGYLHPGDHVISTSIEHNSVRRPLEYLKKKINIDVSYIPSNEKGEIRLDVLRKSINEKTKMLVCSHGSNLLGTIQPIKEISEICKQHNLILLVDAAQTSGTYPIDVEEMGIDMLAFPGHKGLLGPQGTGGLYVNQGIHLEPIIHGGTGSQSEEIDMPNVRPDRYEAGTQNTVGIAGLNEGVKFVLQETVKNISEREWNHTQKIIESLQNLNGIRILGPDLGVERTGVVSFIINDADSSEIAFILDQSFNIAVRSGYHCTPLAHDTAGTTKTGAVRASVGCFTMEEEVDYLIDAIKQIHKYVQK